MKNFCQLYKILAGIIFDKISLESKQASRSNYQVKKQVNTMKTQTAKSRMWGILQDDKSISSKNKWLEKGRRKGNVID